MTVVSPFSMFFAFASMYTESLGIVTFYKELRIWASAWTWFKSLSLLPYFPRERLEASPARAGSCLKLTDCEVFRVSYEFLKGSITSFVFSTWYIKNFSKQEGFLKSFQCLDYILKYPSSNMIQEANENKVKVC